MARHAKPRVVHLHPTASSLPVYQPRTAFRFALPCSTPFTRSPRAAQSLTEPGGVVR